MTPKYIFCSVINAFMEKKCFIKIDLGYCNNDKIKIKICPLKYSSSKIDTLF
jgi:hypothetical protein